MPRGGRLVWGRAAVARPSGAISAVLGLALQQSRLQDQARHDDPNVPEKPVWREASTSAAAFRHGNHVASPEMRLLVLCGRSDLPEAACESLRVLLQAGVDWDVVWEAGDCYGVLPLLSHNLHAVAPRLVPDEMLERLRRRHQATAHRNLYMTAELFQLVGALEGAGIPSIPLKGAVLAHTIYPDPALREFSDIDILVLEEGLSRAKQVLSSLGFLLTRSNLAGGQETAFRWRGYAYFFLRPTDGLVVDLHWKLAPTYVLAAIPVEKLWGQTRSCRIGGMELRSFSPEVTQPESSPSWSCPSSFDE